MSMQRSHNTSGYGTPCRTSLSSFASFHSSVAHTGVPEDLCHLIYCAILHNPGRSEAHTNLVAAFSTAPSFEEFASKVRSLRNNSAPGMSGCSYNMIKSWPEPTLRAAYDCIVAFWENRSIPDHWRWRWLVPTPKKATDAPLMDDLRPLMLTEATRKLWTSIIISKIQQAATQFKTMHDAQHGYKRNRGTDSASLMFINLVESAEACRDSSHRTSYDMSRAFDAVSKNI